VTVTITRPELEIEDERSVEERIAELEALIKEARRRTRRRRAAYAAVMLVALAGVVTGGIGIGGGGGVNIDASDAQGSPASATSTNTSRAGKAAIVASPIYISALQVNPKRPNVVYASTLLTDLERRSVLKSTDGGQTWNAADTSLTEPKAPAGDEDLRVDALALDPRSPNVLYAGTGNGVYKTSDGAKTWKLANNGIDLPTGHRHRLAEGSIYALAVHPVHASTVYAANFAGVWKTSNGGGTWRNVRPGQYLSLAIDPRRPKTVYASAMKDQNKTTSSSIYRTVDGGRSWRAAGPSGLHDNYVGHPIVIDRRSPGMVYAGGSRGLFASANRGRTWKKVMSRGVEAIALDPSKANVLYVGTSHGVVKSEDGGQTWSAPRLAGRVVTSIAIAPTRPQTIYAGVQGGIFASTDDGTTWHRRF
jgi:photosystem II stability/assembly factor-like uncharacterized protein